MDELADVVLQNKNLCSEDPNTWLVCQSLQNAKNVFEWWDDLVHMDDATTETFSAKQIENLRKLRDKYDQISDRQSLIGRQKIRKILNEIFEEGLSIAQVAILCGTSDIAIVQSLIISRRVSREEAFRRIKAETLLRQKFSLVEVAKQLEFSENEIQHWAKTLKIKVFRRNGHGLATDPEVREKAMALYDKGLRGKEICEILKAEMPDKTSKLTYTLVGQWATRSGRTKRTHDARN